jgi:hypothetical protein
MGAFVVSRLMVADTGTPVVATSPSPAARPAASPSQPAQVSPRISPVNPVPDYAPLSQGTVKSVVLTLNPDHPDCATGASCALEVTVNFTKAAADTDYAWTFKAFDPCTNTTTDLGTGHVTAKAGWIQVIGDRSVKVPNASGQLYLVAVTTAPDQAQSPPLTVGQGSC